MMKEYMEKMGAMFNSLATLVTRMTSNGRATQNSNLECQWAG